MGNKEMKKSNNGEISPDELMESFRGRSLKSIIVFTVVIHAVLLLGTSIPFLIKAVTGKDTTALSEKERMELAMKEASDSIREIAEEYDLNVQDITNGFADVKKPKPSEKPVTKTPENPGSESGLPETTPEPSIKQELKVKKEGPEVPKVVDDEEDLFK